MRSLGRIVAAVILGFCLAGSAAADTLELKDGRILHGRYLGGTQAVLRFEINGEVQTFYVSETVALTFTGNSNDASDAAPAPPPSAAPPPAPQSAATPEPAPESAPTPEPAQRPVLSQDVPPQAASSAAPPAAAAAPTGPPEDPAAQYGEVTIPAGQALLSV